LFGGKRGRRRWCGGGVMVVVVVGMEEEMEGRMVVELVEMVGGNGGESGRPWEGKGVFLLLPFVGCWWRRKKKEKNERERKKWGWLYNGGK